MSESPDISQWQTYSPEKWAVRWLASQRALIREHARNRAHARTWLEKDLARAVAQVGQSANVPKLQERHQALVTLIQDEVLPRFDAWFDGSWRPSEPDT